MTISREMLDALLAQLDATDEHVADTDPGPAPLAGLWSGDLDADLAEPVMRQIRFDQFVREVVSLGADIALRMGAAAVAYTVGTDASGEPGPPAEDDQDGSEADDPEE